MPKFVSGQIERHQNLANILDNLGWLFFDKVLQMVGGLLIGIWLARYLGPEQFGQLNYVIAFFGLFAAFATLGTNGIVVRDIVRDPDGTGATLGSAFILLLLGGLVGFILIVSSIAWLRPDDNLTRNMVAILGASLVFKSSLVFKYWFESQLMSRYTVWVGSGVFLVISLIKVIMILNAAPLIAFVWVALVEAVLVAIGLFGIYIRKSGAIQNWSVQLDRSISLLKDSLPLMFMTVLLGIYTKIDMLMIEHFLGWNATGIYAAALKIAEAWFFLAVILVQSLYPSLIKAESFDEEIFKKRLLYFYSFMFWFSFIVSFFLYLFADSLILLLFGVKYIEAVLVFQLYVWSGIFVFVITSSSRWFLIKNRSNSLLARSLLGAVMNVMLNYWLIQAYGLIGAALSTLITYFVVAYIYDVFDKSARGQLLVKLAAIVFPFKLLWVRNV